MRTSEGKRERQYVKYAIIILAVIFIFLGIFVVNTYRALRRAQIINARELQLSALLKNRGPLGANDIGVVRPWMTFDYINKLFNIPPEYLKTRLSISDGRYPQLSLFGYAKSVHLATAAFMSEVTSTLRDYLTNNGK